MHGLDRGCCKATMCYIRHCPGDIKIKLPQTRHTCGTRVVHSVLHLTFKS